VTERNQVKHLVWHQAATVTDRLSIADLSLLSPHLNR
jgi:hypothetical protein